MILDICPWEVIQPHSVKMGELDVHKLRGGVERSGVNDAPTIFLDDLILCSISTICLLLTVVLIMACGSYDDTFSNSLLIKLFLCCLVD